MGWFKRLFSGILRWFWSIIKEIFSGSLEMLIAKATKIALPVVEHLSFSDLTNSEKRKKAFKEIGEAMKGVGLEARESIINLAIEIAVAHLKKIKGEME